MYVVTGFYTPNYAEIAKTFIQNLESYSAPHKIYAVERLGDTWLGQTLRKPEIALRAIAEHPGATVILMDVDCTIHGSLEPLLLGAADISLFIRAKRRDRVHCSSRVVVFRPTEGTNRLLTLWHEKCEMAMQAISRKHLSRRNLMSRFIISDNDESLLMETITETPGITVRILPKEHAGAAAKFVERPLITHDSAHDRGVPLSSRHGLSLIKRARRKLVQLATGMPYEEWRYGGRSSSAKKWG